jgi:hypothetical protein
MHSGTEARAHEPAPLIWFAVSSRARSVEGYASIREAFSPVPGGSRANRTLLSSVWVAAAVPASVLTAARKLKYSWILERFSGLIGFELCSQLLQASTFICDQ